MTRLSTYTVSLNEKQSTIENCLERETIQSINQSITQSTLRVKGPSCACYHSLYYSSLVVDTTAALLPGCVEAVQCVCIIAVWHVC
jgi:hypothetical protein